MSQTNQAYYETGATNMSEVQHIKNITSMNFMNNLFEFKKVKEGRVGKTQTKKQIVILLHNNFTTQVHILERHNWKIYFISSYNV